MSKTASKQEFTENNSLKIHREITDNIPLLSSANATINNLFKLADSQSPIGKWLIRSIHSYGQLRYGTIIYKSFFRIDYKKLCQ